jgi:hypothetical protein
MAFRAQTVDTWFTKRDNKSYEHYQVKESKNCD